MSADAAPEPVPAVRTDSAIVSAIISPSTGWT